MRPRFILVVLVAAATGILCLWLFRPTRVAPISNELQELTAEVPHEPMQLAPKATFPPPAATQATLQLENDFESTSANQNLQERMAELARQRGVSLNVLTQEMLIQASNMVQEIRQTVNRPIEFYGKVIDENGQPIKSASVALGCVIYPEDQFKTNILTDSSGLFAVNSLTGAALFVTVSMEGYVQGTNQNRFEYYSIPGFDGFRPDPFNPIVFHLLKQKKDQPN
jgi:hypothetical protein